MNIFETIESVTNRIEHFHSQFLADALTESLKSDRSLFDSVWALIAPDQWPTPSTVKLETEKDIGEGRVDICIITEDQPGRVVGVEVKTVDDSTTQDQLSRYYVGLQNTFPGKSIQLAYLTPFNADLAGDKAQNLPTVKEFKRFKTAHSDAQDAKHVSWMQVASIQSEGNALWEQHQDYVRRKISSEENLRDGVEQNRSIVDFFGQQAGNAFLSRLDELHPSRDGDRLTIALARLGEPEKAAPIIVSAVEALLGSDAVESRERHDDLADDTRQKFLDSEYGSIHRSLFELSSRFSNVWIQGKGDYGLRIAHRNHRSGVSALRSDGTDRLLVYLKR